MNKENKSSVLKKIMIVILCVIINFAGKYLADILNLPLWLDTLGTCIAAIYTGFAGAIFVGITNNIAYIIVAPAEAPYAFVSVFMAIAYVVMKNRNNFDKFFTAMRGSLITGIIAVICSTPLNVFFYNGYSGNAWGDTLYDMLSWYGYPKVICAFLGEVIVDVIDKQVTVAIAFIIYNVIKKTKERKEKEAGDKVVSYILAFVFLAGSVFSPLMTSEVKADEGTFFADEYIAMIYDSERGIPSSEANCVAQTLDGYIWIGGYSGLTRYDGNSFDYIKQQGIGSVTSLLCDEAGNFWIGTNDNGVFMKDTEENYTSFEEYDILKGKSIRAMVLGDDNVVYIATTDGIVSIGENLVPEFYYETDSFLISMIWIDGGILGINNSGGVIYIKDKVKISSIAEEEGDYWREVECIDETLYIGSNSNYILKTTFNAGQLAEGEKIYLGELSGINDIAKDSEGKIWICCNNGCGYFKQNGNFEIYRNEKFAGVSLDGFFEDYQGNLWFNSTRLGVIKLSKGCFTDVFEMLGISDTVVNSVEYFEGAYYFATDGGLIVIDADSNACINNSLTEMLAGCRIRNIEKGSDNRLYLSTYSDFGEVIVEANGNIENITVDNGATVNRFRCGTELAEGDMVFGTSDGIVFIKDKEVYATLTSEDGLDNTQILSIIKASDGMIYAASDGAGIYKIQDEKVVGHIGRDDGLPSEVVLRIVESGNGFFVITSNALCYMQNDKVRVIENFPYFNNYDIQILEDEAYILSSKGIFQVNREELIEDKEFNYTLYAFEDGMHSSITSNSWCHVDYLGRIWVCCNKGVELFNPHSVPEGTTYKFGIDYILCDDEEVKGVDGEFNLGSEVRNISIKPSVRSFDMSKIRIRFYIEELGDVPDAVALSELEAINISYLDNGEYTVRLEILDSNEKTVLASETAKINIEKHPWENIGYIIYLVLVCSWFLVFLTWMVISGINNSKRNAELEKHREELEIANRGKTDFISSMSHEIRTPINAVLGMNEMIIRETGEAKIKEYAMNVENAGNMLLSLVNDILDITKIESGKLEIINAPYRSGNLINGLVMMAEPRAKAKGLKFVTEISPDIPDTLYGDEVRIRQILTNFITNAIKYTNEGSVILKIEARNLDGKSWVLVADVKDTGIGIKPEDMDKLFSEYDRLEEGKHRNIEGTGLGLSISKNLLSLMDGKVHVESEYGIGSIFHITIPQEAVGTGTIGDFSEFMSKLAEEKKDYRESFTAKNARVLVVDDYELNRRLVKELLKKTKVMVETAASGEEAIGLVKNNKYDLIFMDHMMPGMDGIETIRKMRKLEDNKSSEAPIVMLTANVQANVQEIYEKEGCVSYVAKPVKGEQLEKVLVEYLNKELIDETNNEEEILVAETEKLNSSEENVTAENTKATALEGAEKLEGLEGLKQLLPEIDLQQGRGYLGDDDFYMEILESFASSDRSEEINKYKAEGRIEEYRVIVHALKSGARNVGLEALAKKAEQLEKFAKEKDISSIEANHDVYVEEYKKTINIILEFFNN